MEGVVKDVPVPNEVPPDGAAYQFRVPPLAVAPRVRVPASHLEAGVVEFIIVAPMTAVIAIRADVHPPIVAST
jgi:hypothetical protein